MPTSESVRRWLRMPVLKAIPSRPKRMDSSREIGRRMSIECVQV